MQVEDVSNWSARMREPMEAVYGVEGFPKLWFETRSKLKSPRIWLSFGGWPVKLNIVGQPGARHTSRFGRKGVTYAAMRLTFFLLQLNFRIYLICWLGAQNWLSYACDPWTEGCHGGRRACPLLAWGSHTFHSLHFCLHIIYVIITIKLRHLNGTIFRQSLLLTSTSLKMANTIFI